MINLLILTVQSTPSIGEVLFWITLIVLGVWFLGATVYSDPVPPHDPPVDKSDAVVNKAKTILAAHKNTHKPTYPPEDDTVITEEIEEEPFEGVHI